MGTAVKTVNAGVFSICAYGYLLVILVGDYYALGLISLETLFHIFPALAVSGFMACAIALCVS